MAPTAGFLQFLWEASSPSSTSLLLFLAALSTLLWYLRRYANSKRCNPPTPPGPLGLPLVGNLPFLQSELHKYFAHLAQKYGPIFSLRLGTKTAVVVTSPSIAYEILKHHDVTFSNHDVPAVARAGTYGGIDIPWSPYGPEWRMLRKICVVKMLNNATLDSVYELRRREVRAITKYLYGSAGSAVDIEEQIFLTSFNVVTSMLWGSTGSSDERYKIGAEFRGLVSRFVDLLGLPNVSDFFPSLAWLDVQGLERRMRRLAPEFDKLFDSMIDQRLRFEGEDGGEGRGQPRDFLQSLLNLKEDEETSQFTMAHLKALLMDMVTAGTDTTSTAIEFAMVELIRNPETLRKAQQELDTIVGQKNIVEESHISKLPYIQAVMKEALRLHPVVPLLVPRCPSQSCVVSGYTIPKGSKVFFNAWAIHRDPLLWKKPLEFNPERFLGDDECRDYNGKDFRYFPFGFGRRICVGITMAERMVLHALATLLHSFDWKVPGGSELNYEEKFGIVLKLKDPLVLIPIPRLSDPKLYE